MSRPVRAASSSRAALIAATSSYRPVKVWPNVTTTAMVFSSHRDTASCGLITRPSGRIGT